MKSYRWFNRNRFISIVRVATAGALVTAAAAMAFVAVHRVGPSLAGKSDNKIQPFNKFRMDRDFVSNKLAMPGPELRLGGPAAAAEEDYANRAYPARDIPFSATVNAHAAFNHVKGRTVTTATSAALTSFAWTLIGPSTANFPDILTFSGAAYTTSGRITALAIAPNCSAASCRLWVAAAGGGVWRTDNGLATPPNWTFVSGSFATNAIGTLTYDAAHNTLYAGTGEPNASADSEAGQGIYMSTNGGDSWTHLASKTKTS